MTNTDLYLHKRPSNSEAILKAFAENVLNSFFDDYDLDESHNKLWRLLKDSFMNSSELREAEYPNLIYFYERMHELLIATSILYSERERERCIGPAIE